MIMRPIGDWEGAKGDGDFLISDMVKTLMELIFNPCGEFRWSPDGPVSQIHSPHLHAGAPGISSDLVRSILMLKREWVRKAMANYCSYAFLVKLQPWFLSLRWNTCHCAELQSCCLSLQWKKCPWAEHSDDDNGGDWDFWISDLVKNADGTDI